MEGAMVLGGMIFMILVFIWISLGSVEGRLGEIRDCLLRAEKHERYGGWDPEKK